MFYGEQVITEPNVFGTRRSYTGTVLNFFQYLMMLSYTTSQQLASAGLNVNCSKYKLPLKTPEMVAFGAVSQPGGNGFRQFAGAPNSQPKRSPDTEKAL